MRGELDPEDSHHGGWIVRALFYNSSSVYLSYQNAAASAAGSLNTTWQNRGGRVTAPATAATMRITLWNYMSSGWVAFDDVTLPVQVSTTSYYYFNGQRVAMRKDGALTFLHGDHLGSTSLTTDANGGDAVQQWYYPYGGQRAADGDLPTDYRFTGQRFESMIGGLYDYGARFYDPLLGRFVSADTVVPGAG
ncbi:MAG: RHS repeat-associated core domain-containing protein, partial [Chloroflexi bacterium]|nr:RHS repeat-associated core domain-containing protein [Chloroflexota bacterium]